MYELQLYGFFSVLKYKLHVACLALLKIVLNMEQKNAQGIDC